MAQLVGLIVSEDGTFSKHFGRLLRAGAIPVSVMEDRAGRDGTQPDLIIVDVRGDASSAMSTIERLRAWVEDMQQRLRGRLAARRTRQEIEARARELWDQNGRPPDRDLEFWLQAEAEIIERNRG